MPRRSWAPKRFPIAAIIAGFLVSSTAFAVTVVVTSTADVVTICASTGHPSASGGEGCTLRDAILFSNANPQPQAFANLIQFNIPGSGVQTIGLGSFGSGTPLPAITTGTTIDGYSQPGASPNTFAAGSNAVLLIELFGDPLATRLLQIVGGAGSLIKGLVLNGSLGGPNQVPAPPCSIVLDSPQNVVAGNFIGITADGLSVTPGTLGNVRAHSNVNLIGGSSPADRNVLGLGIPGFPFTPACGEEGDGFAEAALFISGSGNRVTNNYIGTTAPGFSLGFTQDSDGIQVSGDDNFIGGSPAESNVISGHEVGIRFFSGSAFANIVEGNFIGTDATGLGAAPNRIGIYVRDASLNALGALTAGNRIAFNEREGILIQGSSDGNVICCNSIFSNGQLGIDLGGAFDPGFIQGDGVTPNDLGDSDGGPNGLQNFPDLTQASSDSFVTNIVGTLNSLPNTSFRIQFFSNTACDPSGYGEGEDFIGESFIATNANGDASFNASPLIGGLAGQFITSTATNLSTGDTSEFSASVQVEGVGGHRKVKGTIQSIDPPTHSFVLGTAAGGVTVWTDAETKFRKNHQSVDFSALAAGDRTKVKGFQLGDGSVLALKVTVPQEDPDD